MERVNAAAVGWVHACEHSGNSAQSRPDCSVSATCMAPVTARGSASERGDRVGLGGRYATGEGDAQHRVACLTHTPSGRRRPPPRAAPATAPLAGAPAQPGGPVTIGQGRLALCAGTRTRHRFRRRHLGAVAAAPAALPRRHTRRHDDAAAARWPRRARARARAPAAAWRSIAPGRAAREVERTGAMLLSMGSCDASLMRPPGQGSGGGGGRG